MGTRRLAEYQLDDEPVAPGWITTDQGAALTGYNPAYIRTLAKAGRIPAHKVGRDWLIRQDALLVHQALMDALGTQKHNPWRVPGQGRTRK